MQASGRTLPFFVKTKDSKSILSHVLTRDFTYILKNIKDR